MTTDVLPADEWQAEVDQLREDEAIIEAGLATFVDVGQALARIRDGRRYRLEGFDTFEDYCRERWNLARRTAYQLIEGAETVCAMAHITATPITSERQARELAAIVKSDGPERAAEVLEQVAAEGKVTAKAIRETARPTRTVTVVEEVTVDAETGEIVDPQRARLDQASADLDAAMVDVADPVATYLSRAAETDPDIRAANLRKRWSKWISDLAQSHLFDPAEMARIAPDDLGTVAAVAERIGEFFHDYMVASSEQARPGLRRVK